eukprot:3405460-Alexandrium_andersonii.AAC.1
MPAHRDSFGTWCPLCSFRPCRRRTTYAEAEKVHHRAPSCLTATSVGLGICGDSRHRPRRQHSPELPTPTCH